MSISLSAKQILKRSFLLFKGYIKSLTWFKGHYKLKEINGKQIVKEKIMKHHSLTFWYVLAFFFTAANIKVITFEHIHFLQLSVVFTFSNCVLFLTAVSCFHIPVTVYFFFHGENLNRLFWKWRLSILIETSALALQLITSESVF